MTIERADLFADDDIDPKLRIDAGEPAGLEGAANLVVIGDGEDVQVPRRGADEDVGSLRSITPGGVDVEISAPRGKAAPPPPPWHTSSRRPSDDASGCRDMRGHL